MNNDIFQIKLLIYYMSPNGKIEKNRNVLLLGFVSLFTDLSSQMIYPLMPAFLTQIGATGTIIGLIEGIAESTAALFRSVFGKLSDQLGKRKVFVYAGYSLSSLAKPLLFCLLQNAHDLHRPPGFWYFSSNSPPPGWIA